MGGETKRVLGGQAPHAAPRYAIAALGKGLGVLRLFSPERGALSIAEVARLSRSVPSSALRLLNTLVDADFCEEIPGGPRYRPATSALRAGYVALESDRLRQLARPVLEKLCVASGESVILGVLLKGDVVHLDRIEPPGVHGIALPVGARYPGEANALGRAMSPRPPALRRVVPMQEGASAGADGGAAAQRHPGFWIDEHASGLQSRCVAAPITNGLSHAAAAVAIFATGSRWTANKLRTELAPVVAGAAAEINAICYLTAQEQTAMALPSAPSPATVVEPPSELRSRYHIEALSRGMQVLRAFTIDRPIQTVPSLAQSTGLTNSAVFRIVRTLVYEGILQPLASTRAYAPTLGVLELGYSAAAGSSPVELAGPLLMQLRERFGGLSFMSVLAGHESVDVAKFVGQERSVHGPVRYPLYATAGGKVLLAWATESERASILREIRFVEHSARTIRNEADLRRELERVRAQGHAINDEELHPGRWGVAAPVIDSSNRCIAAIGMLVDVSSVASSAEKADRVAHVARAADVISRRLSYLYL